MFKTKSVNSSRSSSSSVSSAAAADIQAVMSAHSQATMQSRDCSPSTVSRSVSAAQSRPTTPSSPVQIPGRTHRDRSAHHQTKMDLTHRRREARPRHCPDSISPSVAALLAITDIPRPSRRRRRDERPLAVNELVNDYHLSEKDISLSLGRGPLDLLLSPPEDLVVDEGYSITESNIGSFLARTASADSVPSLDGASMTTDNGVSVDTPRSLGCSVRRRQSPMRKSLEPIRSPPDTAEEHPLAFADDLDLEELGFPLAIMPGADAPSYPLLQPFKPLRTAFKSNLTASLRALRSAAKSFSNINFPSIPADDFLTRSILTIDPNVPYMDERRPPVTKEIPSAELRRYLNPTTCTHLDAQPKTRAAGTFSASIQMQTYKVQRSQSAPPAAAAATAASAQPATAAADITNSGTSVSASAANQPPSKTDPPVWPAPGMRQREVRENSDFIRIAVMEMAMRRRGKLDSQKSGRARWALPPRRPSAKPYEIGSNGVPTRWISVTY